MHTVRMTAAKLQIETMRMQRELLTWHDAKTAPPKYYEHVLLLINIWYEVEGKKYEKEYMMEGCYHKDNAYCDWMGESLEEHETCLAWRELPVKPIRKPKRPIGSIIKECDEKIPEKPKASPVRILKEGGVHVCSKCGSSIKTRWFGFKKLGCIQPECEDYYKKCSN